MQYMLYTSLKCGLILWLGFGHVAKVFVLVAAYPGNSHRDLDICSHWNGRRHFLELGEKGDLHARNVSASAFRVGLDLIKFGLAFL